MIAIICIALLGAELPETEELFLEESEQVVLFDETIENEEDCEILREIVFDVEEEDAHGEDVVTFVED